MENKRGQFFLLASIIIVSLLAGMFLYSNQVFLQDSRETIQSLKEEVSSETETVIDFGIYRGEDKLEDFIRQMSGNLLVRNSPDMIFFYGNSTVLKILNLGNETINFSYRDVNSSCEGVKQEVSASIGLGGTSLEVVLDLSELESDHLVCVVNIDRTEPTLTFRVQGYEYEVPLTSGSNFYFVIRKEIGEEIYVATG